MERPGAGAAFADGRAVLAALAVLVALAVLLLQVGRFGAIL